MGAHDVVYIADATSASQVTAAQQTAITALTSVSAAINYAAGTTIAQEAVAFQYGGNTYIVETHTAAPTAPALGDTVVELIGAHTISSTLVNTHGIALVS